MNEFFDVLNERGEYLNKVESRAECHKNGLWHRAVVLFIISEDNSKVLLQKRSATKKLWPNLWDVTAAGHVLAGELGYQTVIRETKEEIGVEVNKEDLEYIGSTISETNQNGINNKHFNEYFVYHKNINIDDIVLQEEEVSDIKWITKEELYAKIDNNYDGLTTKIGCWNHLKKYFEIINK